MRDRVEEVRGKIPPLVTPPPRGAERVGDPMGRGVSSGGRMDMSGMASVWTMAMQNMSKMMERMEAMDSHRVRDTVARVAPTRDESSAITVRDAVKQLPAYTEGGDLAKFIHGLEAELKQLKVDKGQWRGILLLKLPAKIKDNVVEHIENGASYDDLVRALLTKVGKSLRELEYEFFPPRRKCTKDRVVRARELLSLTKRVSMLCPSKEELELFLFRGMLYSELPQHECRILSGQCAGSTEELLEAITQGE